MDLLGYFVRSSSHKKEREKVGICQLPWIPIYCSIIFSMRQFHSLVYAQPFRSLRVVFSVKTTHFVTNEERFAWLLQECHMKHQTTKVTVYMYYKQ